MGNQQKIKEIAFKKNSQVNFIDANKFILSYKVWDCVFISYGDEKQKT